MADIGISAFGPVSMSGRAALGSGARAEAEADAVAHDFEAVFLSQFVDQMMKTVGAEAFGGEKQAEMWRSFMSDAIADNLADQGGFGLAANIKQMLAAYQRDSSGPA